MPTEHFGTMSIAGSSYLEGARRLETPDISPQIVYLECAQTIRECTGERVAERVS
ncbi:hypothetical protein [Aquamicrobium sp.]|uniref:hypothetical protein n=1 Tax=Aquamicrobium sp. TaxID=1872579 RepID=UPI0025878007|nr:hypothetical protein [Aquamicrobium sp.]MCK9551944.1 hypothetical protein [Aquamicrobium sp.]